MSEQPQPAVSATTTADAPLVEATLSDKVYEQEKVPVKAIDDLSITVAAGEGTVLAGPSGSGKTALLNMIGGLDRLTESTEFILQWQDVPAAERRTKSSQTYAVVAGCPIEIGQGIQ